MGALLLRIDKYLDTDTDFGAVATLHKLAGPSGKADARSRPIEAAIPATRDPDRSKRIDVDAGHWWIEATLPSGEVITDEVVVRDGDEPVRVALQPVEDSPHEWLGWQHLIGNIEGQKTFADIAERARHETAPDPVGDMLESARGKSRPRGTAARVDIGKPDVRLCDRLGPQGLRGREAWIGVLEADGDDLQRCEPSHSSPEEGLYLYRVRSAGRPSRHNFARIIWGDESYAASLPLPWPNLGGRGGEAEIEVMARMRADESGLSVGVAVVDPGFGPLAGLMTASTLPKARIFVEQAQDMLFGKTENPLAASAGGYVLIATAGAEDKPRWYNWIENLAGMFPDLPDGAVLKATQRLRFPNDGNCYEIARTSLFEAFERGIPFYSTGVAWLLDGLTLFADDDPEARERMKLVHKVAQRTDTSQAFTVIRLGNRKKRS